MIKFSVCIATYKRPDLLKKLIDSLLLQKNINILEVEILIVDNDSEGSAEKVFKGFFGNVNCELSYDIQPEKNISLTRNLAVQKVKGEYIFFIDDDEFANENWMITHINNMKKYDADCAFGQVRSYFSENTPGWIKNCMVYHRNTNPSGEEPANMNTGNCIIKSELFLTKGYQFDPEYGITGGSDYQLFSNILNDGYKLISCYEAITYEYVSESRANVKWLIRRVARTGNNFSRTQIEQANGIKKIIVRIKEFSKGLIQSVIAIIISIILLWNPTKSLNWLLTAVSNISKPIAVLGIYFREYKVN